MATITKVMYDDHARISRLFNKAKQSPSLEMALAVCEELEMHSMMEDELVYPRVEEVAPDTAQRAEEDHGRIKELTGEIEKMDPMSPNLKTTVERLEKVVMRHVDFEEREIFPLLKDRFNDEI